MPFPEVARVQYGKNPLDVVVCQLRFPPILRVDASLPVEFQDRVRADFPDYVESADVQIEVPSAVGDQIPPEILRQVIQSMPTRNYEFASADGQWKINLSRTFIAVTTTRYVRWEEFRERLTLPLASLLENYQPAYFSRIGLRYINKIRRSILNLQGVPWRELLSPSVIGMLGSPETADSVNKVESTQEIRLAQAESIARVRSRVTNEGEPAEEIFVIDADYFHAGRTDAGQAIDRLNFLNSRSSRLIRWAITDRLHQSMEPEAI
jgi:uncharacterized protein (TIGR04255 family)